MLKKPGVRIRGPDRTFKPGGGECRDRTRIRTTQLDDTCNTRFAGS